MRKRSETDYVERALLVVQGRARVKRTMWSRRAQEYDAKINSGDLILISEVERTLYRADKQPSRCQSPHTPAVTRPMQCAFNRSPSSVTLLRVLFIPSQNAGTTSTLDFAP